GGGSAVEVRTAPEAGAGQVLAEAGVREPWLQTLSVVTPPADIPTHITVDVTTLTVGDVVRVGDLVLPRGVTAAIDADTPVVVAAGAAALEVPEAAEGEEGEATEGEAGAESTADAGAAEGGGGGGRRQRVVRHPEGGRARRRTGHPGRGVRPLSPQPGRRGGRRTGRPPRRPPEAGQEGARPHHRGHHRWSTSGPRLPADV